MKSRLSRHLRIGPTEVVPFPALLAADVAVAFQAAAATTSLGHDPELAPRDTAIYLLHTAAEVEHALMIQYLYAAYSLGGAQVPQDKGRKWKSGSELS